MNAKATKETTTDAASEAAPAAVQQKEDGFEFYNLTKPIDAHGETLKVLRVREPTGLDIERCGVPIVIDFSIDPPKLTFDEKKMAAMISMLAAIPASSVRSMSPKDWVSVAWGIAGFFTPNWGA